MRILIDRKSKSPLYEQVEEALKRLILDGVLSPGDELPASRVLAKDLGLNRGTITTAYDDLVADGLLYRHVGRGTFVARREELDQILGVRRTAPRRVDGRLRWPELYAYDALKDQDPLSRDIARWSVREGTISFAGGVPDSALFPTDEFRLALNRALKEEGPRLLMYGTTSGHRPFIEFLRHYLVERGVGATPDEILVVNGSQQGIDLVARTLVAPGDAIVVEDPSYHGALNLFRTLRARIVPVPVDEHGLDVDQLERILANERPKLLYTMPTFQNPTGVSMSLERRRRLVTLCADRNVPILEDDFDGDLLYDGDNIPPLKGLPEGRDVIYTGTFSKMLFPGIRLGWVVAPAPVVERLAAAKQAADLSTSLLFQAAMVRFAQGKRLVRHAEEVRAEYRKRRDALLKALAKEMPDGVTWTKPAGGFSLVVRLPQAFDSADLLPRAAEKGVVYTPGRVFSLSGERRLLRLSFGNLKSEQIVEGVRRLAAALKEDMTRSQKAAGGRTVGAVAPPV
jgi:DNA-binding transcriptional MocR family regulator